MKIGAAQREIRRAVAFFGRSPSGIEVSLPARDAVMDDDRVGPEGVALDRIERAERCEAPGGVGTELNSGARLLGELGAFEDFAGDPLPRERDGRSEPANAAAGNECLPLAWVSRLKPREPPAGLSPRRRKPAGRSRLR